RTRRRAGINSAMRTATMPMTTSSSTSVKALCVDARRREDMAGPLCRDGGDLFWVKWTRARYRARRRAASACGGTREGAGQSHVKPASNFLRLPVFRGVAEGIAPPSSPLRGGHTLRGEGPLFL